MVFFAAGGIAAQGQDILQARLANAVEDLAELTRASVAAGEVHHGFVSREVLNVAGDLDGAFGGGPTCPPCDVDEERLEAPHSSDAGEEVFKSCWGLRWEKLERKEGAFGDDGGADLVDNLHAILCSMLASACYAGSSCSRSTGGSSKLFGYSINTGARRGE